MQTADFPLPFVNAPYSRAMFDDEWIFVSGTIGMDYDTQTLAVSAEDQTRLMVRNIEKYLAACGGRLEQVINYTLIVAGAEHLGAVVQTLSEVLPCKPTGTAMLAGIAVPKAWVEMQVIARKSQPVSEAKP
ncbi:Rid family hydrolase [Variovorax sp. EBFNA2]|uniref:Rid family hydrolase n=1 Tax=Variovorax sp. EBFNA2 TaxID=3342097 RepID=UPI0029C0BC98|nr:Rid family hydrolase [Variovorax boronicumulans]WPG36196.1 Rid family hydrolase [Variovorax boronicumulans]